MEWMIGTRSKQIAVPLLLYFSDDRPLFHSAQYTYLVSRTCDRLAEIFQQADPSSIPEQAMNVFLFVHRFEQFDGVDATALDADNAPIDVEELKKIVRCLKSRSASLLGR